MSRLPNEIYNMCIGNIVNCVDKNNLTPLQNAIYANDLTLVEKLLNEGASPTFSITKDDPINCAVRTKNTNMIKLIYNAIFEQLGNLTNLHCEKAFLDSIASGHVENVAFFIKKGMDINKKYITYYPLSIALYSNHKIIELLLNNGANVNIENYLYKALFIIKDFYIADLLIKHGCNINEYEFNQQENYLLTACVLNETKVAKFLIEKGANTNATTEYGTDSLHFAKFHKNEELIELLKPLTKRWYKFWR